MKIPTPDEFTKAGGYHPFPGKWSRWLNAVRDEILTSAPVAGRHVTIDEHPGKGTVINVDDTSSRRKVTPPPPPGCAGCALPGGDCPHAIGITIKFDGTESDNESDFLEFIDSGGTNGISMFYFDAGANQVIQAGDWTGASFCNISIPTASFFNVPLNICVNFSRLNNTTVNVAVTVAGHGSGSFTIPTPTHNPDTLHVGARFNEDLAKRTISCVALLANPPTSEEDFVFPPDSFDSFTGGASITGGILVIDDTGDAYATKTVTPYDLDCHISDCCGDPSTSYPFTGSASASYHATSGCLTYAFDSTSSFSGSLVIGHNVLPTHDDPCHCIDPDHNCNVIDNCPDNFSGNCSSIFCTYTHNDTDCPDGDSMEQLCAQMEIEVEITCRDLDGWYLRVFLSSGEFCISGLSWETNAAGDGYIKIADCGAGPYGSHAVTLDPVVAGPGSASATITI